jgi:hypothetical protein
LPTPKSFRSPPGLLANNKRAMSNPKLFSTCYRQKQC